MRDTFVRFIFHDKRHICIDALNCVTNGRAHTFILTMYRQNVKSKCNAHHSKGGKRDGEKANSLVRERKNCHD